MMTEECRRMPLSDRQATMTEKIKKSAKGSANFSSISLVLFPCIVIRLVSAAGSGEPFYGTSSSSRSTHGVQRSMATTPPEFGRELGDSQAQDRGLAFEDQVSAWRRQQMERSQQFHDNARNVAERLGYDNPDQVADQILPQVDEKGRMSLVQNSVAKSSLAFWFFILMWRSVMLYELADSVKSAAFRIFVVTPPAILFVGNMLGCVLAVMSVTSVPHSITKKRLKALLNMNKFLELIMFLYNFIRLTVWPNHFIPKEIYVGRIIHNVLYTVASQTFTKVTWDAVGENTLPKSGASPYYDDKAMSGEPYYSGQEALWDDDADQTRGRSRY